MLARLRPTLKVLPTWWMARDTTLPRRDQGYNNGLSSFPISLPSWPKITCTRWKFHCLINLERQHGKKSALNNKHSVVSPICLSSSFLDLRLERKSKNAKADHSLFSIFSLLLHSKNQLIVSNLAKLCSLQNRRMHYHFSFRSLFLVLLLSKWAGKLTWAEIEESKLCRRKRRRLFKLVSLLQRSKTNQGHHGLKGRGVGERALIKVVGMHFAPIE